MITMINSSTFEAICDIPLDNYSYDRNVNSSEDVCNNVDWLKQDYYSIDIDEENNQTKEFRAAFLSFISLSNICIMYILVLLTRMSNKYFATKKESEEEEDEGGEEPRKVVPVRMRPPPIHTKRKAERKYDSISIPTQLHHHGDLNYKRACKLSEMVMTLINEYMSRWYRKVMEGEDDKISKWHPYILHGDIDISGYIMVRVMNTRMHELSNGMIEYMSVVLSSVIFHGLMRGPKQVMEDVQDLYKLKLPTNCVTSYNIRLIRSYRKATLKKAYYNHMDLVKENADERMKTSFFESQLEIDKAKAYNEDLKKMVLHVLAEINWRTVLVELANNYVEWEVEESESDCCLSPRVGSIGSEDERNHRRSYL